MLRPMASCCFYDRASYAAQPLPTRLAYGLVAFWSRPFIHVDIRAGGKVLSANLFSGRAMLHDADNWDEPALVMRLPWGEERVLALMHDYEHRQLRYGLLDLLLMPLRRFVRFDGHGVICSELVAEMLLELAADQGDGPWPEIERAVTAAGAHALTPQGLHAMLRGVLPVSQRRRRRGSGCGHQAVAGPL